jgi:UDP:flavonoid glycosyltransferase YjiC (YdhE family)
MIQSGWAQLSVHTDDVLTIGQTPYDWLFPRMAAVVHHAGAGTVGAALRAGVPTFAVPVIIDQPFWAGRIAALGVGPPPIPFWRLSKERLAAAISAAVSDPGYRERAKTVSAAVNQEDGAGRVLEEVRRLLD